MPLAARRTRRPRILPARFRDDVPQPLTQVPPPSIDLSNLPVEARPSCERPIATVDPAYDNTESPAFSSSVVRCFRTPRNFHFGSYNSTFLHHLHRMTLKSLSISQIFVMVMERLLTTMITDSLTVTLSNLTL